MNSSFPNRDELKKGMTVGIVEKHNQAIGIESEGAIDRILTHDTVHPHGIKVMLTDGRVGRVKRVIPLS